MEAKKDELLRKFPALGERLYELNGYIKFTGGVHGTPLAAYIAVVLRPGWFSCFEINMITGAVSSEAKTLNYNTFTLTY